MNEVKLPREWIFFVQGTVQHGRGGWKRNHGLGYDLYLIREDVSLKGADEFVDGDSMQGNVQNKREVLLSDMGPVYMFDNSVPRNSATVEMTEKGDENNAMGLWPNYSIYAMIGED